LGCVGLLFLSAEKCDPNFPQKEEMHPRWFFPFEVLELWESQKLLRKIHQND